MWMGLTILFFLISIFTSLLVYYSLRRITQYEELILEIQQVIQFIKREYMQRLTN
jgi:hypothetical protein